MLVMDKCYNLSMSNADATERVCTRCREIKSLDAFSAAPRGKYGRKSSCKDCDAARHRELHPPKPRVSKPRRAPLLGSAEKRCTKCGETKTVDEFSLTRRATATTNDIYKSWCKPCSSAAAMQWYRTNSDRAVANKRKFNLKSLYGLTVQEYDDMVRAQHGGCAVCGGGRDERLCVDHCHDTGAVRGLLCNRCNRAIGLLGDDPQVLRKAISYLLRSQERKV